MKHPNDFNDIEKTIRHFSKVPVKDRPRGVDFTFPGLDSSKVIHSYPEYLTDGPQFRLLWDNEVTQFIKKCFMKLFRRR